MKVGQTVYTASVYEGKVTLKEGVLKAILEKHIVIVWKSDKDNWRGNYGEPAIIKTNQTGYFSHERASSTKLEAIAHCCEESKKHFKYAEERLEEAQKSLKAVSEWTAEDAVTT